ncbi:hypothetical protein ACX27O_25470 [Micromonospora sp. SD19]
MASEAYEQITGDDHAFYEAMKARQREQAAQIDGFGPLQRGRGNASGRRWRTAS